MSQKSSCQLRIITSTIVIDPLYNYHTLFAYEKSLLDRNTMNVAEYPVWSYGIMLKIRDTLIKEIDLLNLNDVNTTPKDIHNDIIISM